MTNERLEEIRDSFLKDKNHPHSPSPIWGEGSQMRLTSEEYFDTCSREFVFELLEEIDRLKYFLSAIAKPNKRLVEKDLISESCPTCNRMELAKEALKKSEVTPCNDDT